MTKSVFTRLAKTPSEATKLSTTKYHNWSWHVKNPTYRPDPKMCEISTDHRCGSSFGSKICGIGWCSIWNWCGTSSDHKSTNQASYNSVSKGNTKCGMIVLANKKRLSALTSSTKITKIR